MPMKREPRSTPLVCENDHHFTADIEWVDMRVGESSVPDWRPITEGETCPTCGARVFLDGPS